MITNKKISKVIDEVFSSNAIGELVNTFNKASNKSSLKLRLNDRNLFFEDLSKSITRNDLIEFEENNLIVKAVVTAVGKHGVTARDKDQRKVQIKFQNIAKHTKRNL